MIDWVSVAFSLLWIAGLALVLAALSYTYWLAREQGLPVGPALQQPGTLRFVYGGLLLVGVGLAGTAETTFQIALAVILIALCGLGLMRLYRQTRENRS